MSHDARMNGLSPRHHVLLVGIDAYEKVERLHGCVNDADALEAIFLDRLSVPAEAITKLVAPHPGAARHARGTEDKPTSTNLRRAFEALTTDAVRPGDRVFVHYSGHGTQVLSRASRTAREALVPVDALAGGELLFDYEINEILRRIAARTHDLTVILDCCCSAGATRSGLVPRNVSIRFCRIGDDVAKDSFARYRRVEGSSGLLSAFDPSDPGFLVVASAQSGEAANEGQDAHGVRHGAFTAALLDLLRAQSADKLHSLRWADVWQALRAQVTSVFPGQHPCLIGRSERRLFGGHFQRQDAGFPIAEVGGKYHLHAGTLVGLGEGAIVGVYGPEPPFFPTLRSREDTAAQRGLLRVESATPSSAVALPVGAHFRLESGARARLVKPGRADDLVVGLDPFDVHLARYLESEGPFRVLANTDASEYEVEAIVGSSPDGHWWIGDEVFGEDAPLALVKADRSALAQGLWHYCRYNLPLRLVRRCREAIGVLHLRVLDAHTSKMLAPEEFHNPPLPEAEPDPARRYRYQIIDGQPVCFSVENRSANALYVNVINCSASGRVELLGPTQLEIAPKRRQTFWLHGHLGRPFPCRISTRRDFNIERLVVVGTTSPDVDLSYLRVKESFANTIAATSREASSKREEPSDFWAAARVTVMIVPNHGNSC